jgi:hypothetical protein
LTFDFDAGASSACAFFGAGGSAGFAGSGAGAGTVAAAGGCCAGCSAAGAVVAGVGSAGGGVVDFFEQAAIARTRRIRFMARGCHVQLPAGRITDRDLTRRSR